MGLSLCATGANADAPSAGVTMSWGQVCPCPSVNERWDLFWVIRWDLYWNSGFHATDDRFCATTVGLCTKKRCTSLIGKTYPLQTLSFVPRGAGVRWVKMMHFAFKTRNFVLKTRNFAFYTRNCALKTRNCALKMIEMQALHAGPGPGAWSEKWWFVEKPWSPIENKMMI